MATSIKYPQSNDGGAPGSGGTFSNLTYAYADDANLSNILSITRSTVHTVRYYNFNMQIPAGATINSVNIEVEWKVDTTISIAKLELQIAKGTTKQGTALINAAEPTSLTTENTSSNGSWTVSELNDNTSGTGLSVIMTFTQGADNDDWNGSWNYLKITVDYTTTVQHNLAAVVNGASTVTGDTDITKLLTSTVNGTSTVASATSVTRNLAGVVNSTSSVAGVLDIVKYLAAEVNGASIVSSAASITKLLTATVNGVSTVTGKTSVARNLSTVVASATTVTAKTSIFRRIISAITGSGVVTGVMKLYKRLTGTASAVTTITTGMQITKLTSAAINAIPTVTVALYTSGGGIPPVGKNDISGLCLKDLKMSSKYFRRL